MPQLYIIIPAFNEAATIAACLARVRDAPLPDASWTRHIIIIDDFSSDGTREALAIEDTPPREHGNELIDRMTFIRHSQNRGKGAALQTGFDAVLAMHEEVTNIDHPVPGVQPPVPSSYIIIQDADLEYDPNDYATLLDPLIAQNADAVFGNRWGEHFRPRGVWRRVHAFGNGALTSLSNMLTGYRISDMECCYKVLPLDILKDIRPMLTEERFGIEPQIAAALSRIGATVVERPVRYDPRSMESGKKIGWRDAFRAFYVIVREKFRKHNRG